MNSNILFLKVFLLCFAERKIFSFHCRNERNDIPIRRWFFVDAKINKIKNSTYQYEFFCGFLGFPSVRKLFHKQETDMEKVFRQCALEYGSLACTLL